MNFVITESILELEGGTLFNSAKFHKLKKEDAVNFALVEDGTCLARCCFYPEGDEVISGYKAPFGSIDYLEHSSLQRLSEMIEAAVKMFSEESFNKVRIKQAPNCYRGSQNVAKLLENLGFAVEVSESNQHLAVDDILYASKISQKERNKLNRAISEGYSFQQLTPAKLPDVYQLISDTHNRKNYPVTQSLEELQKSFEAMPESYFLFGLYNGSTLIASIVSVRVSKEVLYNVFHADLETYRTRSPLVMLIGGVYQYAKDNDFKILDLGISSVEGKLNEGLYKFKKNLGCLNSEKNIYAKGLR